MHDRHAEIAEHVLGEPDEVGRKDGGKRLPGVKEGVLLEEVVLASIAGYLELRAEPVPRTCRSCSAQRAHDALQVARKIHGPLVEVACRNSCQCRLHLRVGGKIFSIEVVYFYYLFAEIRPNQMGQTERTA